MMDEKIINRDLDSIEQKAPKPSFNASAYRGKLVMIDKVEEIETVDPFSIFNPVTKQWESTDTYNPNSTKMIHQIKITTVPLKKLKEDGNLSDDLYEFKDEVANIMKHITISETFNLKEESEDKWIISKHPKAKLWKFMRNMKVDKLTELKGMEVSLTTEASSNPEDDREYLRIVI